jgi:hypothetical protein
MQIPIIVAGKPPKRRHGKTQPAITEEIAERVGFRVGCGKSLTHALSSEDPPIPLAHWKAALESSPRKTTLWRAFAKNEARGVDCLLAQVDPSVKNWQAAAWKLERTLGYVVPRGPAVQVNVQNVVGIGNDVIKRARQIREHSAKRIAASKVIDVEVVK